MRNRAKCALCASIIESFVDFDYVSCSCGEIAISGGQRKLECYANDFKNFLRIDDIGKIIIPIIQEQANVEIEPKTHVCKQDLLETLDQMIKTYENLPSSAMSAPLTHYDALSILTLISELLRCD